MKIITFFLILLATLQTFSQNTSITDNEWVLQELTVDGNTINTIPNNSEIHYIKLGFLGNNIVTYDNFACGGFFLDVSIDSASSTLSITENFNPYEISCLENDNIEFTNTYYSFFQNSEGLNFTYGVVDTNNEEAILTLTSSNGDQALFINNYFPSVPTALSANSWYLEKIVENNTEFFPPYANGLDVIEANFLEEVDFWTNNCQLLMAQIHYNNESESFHFDAKNLQLENDCENFTSFINLYNSFFNAVEELNFENSFDFQINQNSTHSVLILTNTNGDQAYYNSEFLSLPTENRLNVSVYPNPAREKIYFSSDSNLPIKWVHIFDATGKKIKLSIEKNSIDVSSLKSGIYFAKLEINNRTVVKKISIE